MQDACLAPETVSPSAVLEQVDGLDGYIHIVVPPSSAQTSDASSALEWFIYFKQGQISFATHTADAFERLERHLRSLSNELPEVTHEVRTQLRADFEQPLLDESHLTADYRAINWLAEQGYLDPILAGTLVSKLIAEVFESYLLLPQGDYQVQRHRVSGLPTFCRLDPQSFLPRCRERLNLWGRLLPRIRSPYQRPYLIGEDVARQKLAPEAVSSLSRLLIGFNFRQLAMFLKQDELMVAQRFAALIDQGVVILRDPVAPFNQLPTLAPSAGSAAPSPLGLKLAGESAAGLQTGSAVSQNAVGQNLGRDVGTPSGGEAGRGGELGFIPAAQRTWQIVCIDDSQAMLSEIQRLLEGNAFSLTLLTDPKKALMKIISIKPDLILLDVTMPEVDGYQVCSMIRKSSAMRHIPVVMVTGNRGLIDRARAKMVGATDYLTKPFSQKDLLGILFRHLSD